MREEKGHIGRPTKEEVKKRKQNKITKIILSLIIIIILFLGGCMIFSKFSAIKLNKTTNIEKDNIKLTVHGAAKVNIDKGTGNLANGDWIKVKLTIENYGSEIYDWDLLTFSLGKEIPSGLTFGQDDLISFKINPGEKTTGFLYFPVTPEEILTYSTSMEVKNSKTIAVTKYKFKIK